MRQESLFPLRMLPTLRQVATTVRAGGEAALVDARRKADQATYQEVRCRSALNPVRGMPFQWTLNPYRGCTHGCHYCFARRYHRQFELDADDQFASVILVKVNVVGVLARELARPTWARELVALGTATDPYQPIEGQYKLTRGAIVELAAARTPLGIVTKGPMVVRDIDVLQEASRAARCTVYVSVPTVDEEAWRKLEPGAADPRQRLRAVRKLTRAGIRAGVLIAPMVPGITTSRGSLEATLAAIAAHEASFVGANLLHLESGTREHFLGFLAREFPRLVDGYERLYAGGAKRVPRGYAEAVHDVLAEARRAAGTADLPQDPETSRGPRGGAGHQPVAGARDPRAGRGRPRRYVP
jgi:DNA repair photolyase